MSDNKVFDAMETIIKAIAGNETIGFLCNDNVSFVIGVANEELTAGELQDDSTIFKIAMNGEADLGRIATDKVIPLVIRITHTASGIVDIDGINYIDGWRDLEAIVFETKSIVIESDMGEDLALFSYQIDGSGLTKLTATINLEIRQPNILDNN